MTRSRRPALKACGLLLVPMLALLPAGILAQQGPPYRLEHLEGYLAVRLSPDLILSRVEGDCLAFRMDAEAERRLRAAGAREELLNALRSVCFRGPEGSPEPPIRLQLHSDPPGPLSVPLTFGYDPRAAAVRSLALPGLGQLYTDRPEVGALFFAGWAGALGLGVMTREVTVECMDRVAGGCPPDRVLSESVRRPWLGASLGGALALAVLSAWEARSGAKRANARRIALGEESSPGGILVEVFPSGSTGAARDLVLVQVRFWWRTKDGTVASLSAEGNAGVLTRGPGAALISTTVDGESGSLRIVVQEATPAVTGTPMPSRPEEAEAAAAAPFPSGATVDSLRAALKEVEVHAGAAAFERAYPVLDRLGARLAELRAQYPGAPVVADLDREYLDVFRDTYVRCDMVRRTMLERGEANPPTCRAPPRGGGDGRI